MNKSFECPKCGSTNTRISKGTPPHALRWDCDDCRGWGWVKKDIAASLIEEIEAQKILNAVVYLSDCCDGANELDGQGFNKYDADNGHRIANLIRDGEDLSFDDYQKAKNYVHKYRGQLESFFLNEERVKESQRLVEEVEQRLYGANPISENQQGLNQGQRIAFSNILSWFHAKDESPDQSVLKGWAGCGKTFLVQRVAKELKQSGYDILFCAPTHKANNVLATMAFKANLSVKCETIHRIAGLKMELNSDGRHQAEKQRDGYFTDYDFVVADECSMISRQLYAEFPKYTERTKILFMGDPDQLPPINEEAGSLTFKLDTQFEVTEVMRFSGLIGSYTKAIRENMNSSSLPDLGIGADFNRASNGAWLRQILEAFVVARDTEELYKNPDGIRVLSYTNKRVNRLNQEIRNALYGADSVPYFVGERLMAKKNISQYRGGAEWNNGSKYTFMSPCAEGEVLSLEFIEKYPVYMPTEFEENKDGSIRISGHQYFIFGVWKLEVLTDVNDRSFVHVLDSRDRDRAAKALLAWREAIKNISHKQLRTSQWSEWFKACDALTIYFDGNQLSRKLQYAFCLTIHQSQGSTFQTVFADSDVYWQKDLRQRNQLLYVQFSRASRKLIVNNGF
jgi:exodeoxyribonuclease-5